jgi:aminoglycoside phosphotransferase (APT) family kinase protein
MPAAEVEIDEHLVRLLLASQFPRWASLPLRPTPAIGWDNTVFRLGSELAVRLPRRTMGAVMVAKQHRWLPELAIRLPVAVPVPIGQGVPEHGYPWRWSVCPWLPGNTAASTIAYDAGLPAVLGGFIAALHVPGPADGPRSEFRGVPLMNRDDQTRSLLETLRHVVDGAAATRIWDDALAAEHWSSPDVWLHGDLHPGNLLLASGRLSGVIDFDHLVVGDPAVDLISAWMLLAPIDRALLRDAVKVDDATWTRGRAWALNVALMMLAHSSWQP